MSAGDTAVADIYFLNCYKNIVRDCLIIVRDCLIIVRDYLIIADYYIAILM